MPALVHGAHAAGAKPIEDVVVADAHGDHGVLDVAAPPALLKHMAGEPRAGHPERMADGDRAAVDVVLFRVDAEGVAAIEALAGEGLVEFPQVNVVDLQA